MRYIESAVMCAMRAFDEVSLILPAQATQQTIETRGDEARIDIVWLFYLILFTNLWKLVELCRFTVFVSCMFRDTCARALTSMFRAHLGH